MHLAGAKNLSPPAVVVTLLVLAGLTAFAQTAPVSVRAVTAGEKTKLNLGLSESAKPKEGTRFVTVRLQIAPSVQAVEDDNLVLVSTSSEVFEPVGIADADGSYCLGTIDLEREGGKFKGVCASMYGGDFSFTVLEIDRLVVAFVVPVSVPLNALQLSYTVLRGTVPVDPPALTRLPNGLTAEVRQVTESEIMAPLDPERKLVTLSVEVKNEAQRPFRIHVATVRLQIPRKESWISVPPLIGAADMTEAAENEKRPAKPLTTLGPGETRTFALAFSLKKDEDIKRCRLAVFREHTSRLVAAGASPSKKP
ncbi:MAG: hypothetical protein HYY26_02465 [Acidobacteria bacterium]|nr:hypothetical protein [Acidobacteriota bacterium]